MMGDSSASGWHWRAAISARQFLLVWTCDFTLFRRLRAFQTISLLPLRCLSCLPLVLVGSLVGRPYFRVSGFIDTTYSRRLSSVRARDSRNGQVAMHVHVRPGMQLQLVPLYSYPCAVHAAPVSQDMYDDETAFVRHANTQHFIKRLTMVFSRYHILVESRSFSYFACI